MKTFKESYKEKTYVKSGPRPEPYDRIKFIKKFGTPGMYEQVNGLYRHVRINSVNFTKDKAGMIFHNENDEPANELMNGFKSWYKDGKQHRLNGPAVIWVNGDQEFWVNGENIAIEDVEKYQSPKNAFNASQILDI